MSTKAYTYGYGICVEKIKDGQLLLTLSGA